MTQVQPLTSQKWIHCVSNHWILKEPFKEDLIIERNIQHNVDLLVVGKYLFCVYVPRFCWDNAALPCGLNVLSLYEMMRVVRPGFMNIKLCRYSNSGNMRHKVNINCTLWVYCSNNITRLYWPFQPARESFIYGIFALCKVCGSKRLIIESLAPKKIILFLEQRLMFCKMMLRHKWFLSHQIYSFLFTKILATDLAGLCFEGLVAISSRVMFQWGPPGSAQGCLPAKICGVSRGREVNAALWEEMSPRSQNAGQTHFLETRALSQNQFLWEMECQHDS